MYSGHSGARQQLVQDQVLWVGQGPAPGRAGGLEGRDHGGLVGCTVVVVYRYRTFFGLFIFPRVTNCWDTVPDLTWTLLLALFVLLCSSVWFSFSNAGCPPLQWTTASTSMEVEAVIAAAEHLGVPELTVHAVKDAGLLLSTSNAVALSNLSWSGRAGLERLQAASFEFLRANFDAMRGHLDLCIELSLPVFRSLVCCASLHVVNEDALLDAVWRRLSGAKHSEDEVEALLGGIRMKLLSEESMETLSRVADGEFTAAVPAPYPALQRGALACVLRGLRTLSTVRRDKRLALSDACVPRGVQVKKSACVMYGLDQTGEALSPFFHVGGHKWQLVVSTRTSGDDKTHDVAVFLHWRPPAAATGTAEATVYFWSLAVDGGRFSMPSAGDVRVRCLVARFAVNQSLLERCMCS